MENVRLEGIQKIYDNGFVAVQGVDLSVGEGEFIVLVGPSGCGKSTILRMIAGLESITDGSIYIGGRLVNDIPPKDRDIAMVFQNYALYPHMSVYDNMAFGLKLRKYPAEEIRNRVGHAAQILGLEDILDRKPRRLSGGQRQRVAVGRAIVRKPRVFLLDEPLSNLDAKLRVQMRTEISKLHQQLQATMIYVTHDQVEAMTMGDRIVVLRDGFVEQIDTPINLYNRPTNLFVAGFIGSPSMNFLNGKIVRNDGLRFQEDGDGISLPLTEDQSTRLSEYVDKPVTLGIRPEDIYIADSVYIRERVAGADLSLTLLETMGSEIVIYTKTTGGQLVARVAPQELPSPGHTIRLAFVLDKFHFFNPETGLCIRG